MSEDTVKRLMGLARTCEVAHYTACETEEACADGNYISARSTLESALREALLPAPLPTGWLIADDIAAAKPRWAAHVFGSIAPPNHERVPYSSALNDLRSALSRMSAAPSATTAPAEVPLPTSAEPMGDVMARLSKTPAEAYERGYLDGFAKAQEVPADARDAALLDWLCDHSADLRCFDIPTGDGDGDIGWRVIEHFMAAPHERVRAEVFVDDPRAAIRAAIDQAMKDTP